MFANLLAFAPDGAGLAVASTTLLGLAGLGLRYVRIRSNERIIITALGTDERMHARETLREMHRNELATTYGMHANQLDAKLKAQVQARSRQWWAGTTRGLDSSFTLLPPETPSYPELTGRTPRHVWYDREINDLEDLRRIIGDQ